jgi:hypothetical protein
MPFGVHLAIEKQLLFTKAHEKVLMNEVNKLKYKQMKS